MNTSKQFEKINTNDQDIEEMEIGDLKITNAPNKKLVTDKTRLSVLCLLGAIALLIIGFLCGYFVNDDNQTNTAVDHNYYIRDESCLNRKCCKAIDIRNKQQHSECSELLLMDCIAESEFCEWYCGYNESDINTRRSRKFNGISTGIGNYTEGNASNISTSEPSSVGELITMSTLISIDDCGVMYEETLSYDQAVQEFADLNKQSEGIRRLRRRMQDGGGLSGSDIQTPIGSDGGGLIGSDQSVGCITYKTGGGSWGDNHGTAWEYDHICTGTLIAPKWVLTSGDCCHPPSGSNFYANWYYYPEIKYHSDIAVFQQRAGDTNYKLKAYKAKQANVYGAWRYYGNYDWDLCIIELYDGYYGANYYMKLDYNIENYMNTQQLGSYAYWNSLGYRHDKYSNNVNNGWLIYGWTQKWLYSVTIYKFSYYMDTHSTNTYYQNGYGGSPLYWNNHDGGYGKQYCVTSSSYNRYHNGRNYCTRITLTSYNDFCGKYWDQHNGQWLYGKGYGYCN